MIQKTLEKHLSSEKKQIKEHDPVNDVKLLIDADSMRDVAILNSAFPASVEASVLEVSAKHKNIESLKKKYGGDVYTINQIQKICIDYRLRFLQSRHYTGKVPVDILHKINESLKINSLSHLQNTSGSALGHELYVIAPVEMFKTTNQGIERIKQIKEAKRLARLDPALFLKIDEEHFLYITEWGNSFTFLRKIIAYPLATNHRVSIIAFFVYLFSLFCFIGGMIHFANFAFDENNHWIYVPIYFITLISGGLLFITFLFDDMNTLPIFRRFKDEEFFKMRRNISSSENWNSQSVW